MDGRCERRRLPAIVFCAALAAAVSLVAGGSAVAGGWWNYIDPGGPVWAPGLRVEATAGEVVFPSLEATERVLENGAYHAYLLEGFDFEIVDRVMMDDYRPGWWSLGGATANRLGPVVFSHPDANLVRATARFTVPDVAPGRYSLMFCTIGCVRPLVGVIPVEVTVIEDAAVAEVARRIEHVRGRADRKHWALEGKVRKLTRRVDRLTRALEGTGAPTPTPVGGRADGPPAAVPALLGWAGAAGALGAATVMLRRRRNAHIGRSADMPHRRRTIPRGE